MASVRSTLGNSNSAPPLATHDISQFAAHLRIHARNLVSYPISSSMRGAADALAQGRGRRADDLRWNCHRIRRYDAAPCYAKVTK
eukprot:6177952-Pleurochrysis_carterae.AAC.1